MAPPRQFYVQEGPKVLYIRALKAISFSVEESIDDSDGGNTDEGLEAETMPTLKLKASL